MNRIPLGISARSQRAHRLVAPFSGRNGFVRLDRNEDPVGWPMELVDEFTSSITPESLAAYPDPALLTSRIGQWVGRNEREVLVTNGSTEGLRLVFETFVDETKTTVRLDPSYSLYELYESVAGSHNLVTPYSPDLVPPIGDLVTIINTNQPALVVVANPDQPTGVRITLDEIHQLAEASATVGAVLAVDEAYHLFGAETALPLISKYPNLVVIRTFSKAFGLAGLRLGYLVGDEQLIGKLRRLEPAVPPSSISLLGGVWVLDHMEAALGRVADAISGRQYLDHRLREAGSPAFPSFGNFLLIPLDSEAKARAIVSGSRDRGFLIKGPLNVRGVGACVRVTIGPLALMEDYWRECGTLYS